MELGRQVNLDDPQKFIATQFQSFFSWNWAVRSMSTGTTTGMMMVSILLLMELGRQAAFWDVSGFFSL